MSTKRSRQARSSTGLIITLLALVAVIGLLTGILAHTLVTLGAGAARISPTATTQISATHTPGANATSADSPTSTATTSVAASKFQLSVNVTPRNVAPGQSLTITVTAFAPDTHAPVAGLPCVLRAPVDGSPALFTTWPPAMTTDSAGAATWSLTAPTRAAGAYEVEAFAQTSKWSWKTDSTITLSVS